MDHKEKNSTKKLALIFIIGLLILVVFYGAKGLKQRQMLELRKKHQQQMAAQGIQSGRPGPRFNLKKNIKGKK